MPDWPGSVGSLWTTRLVFTRYLVTRQFSWLSWIPRQGSTVLRLPLVKFHNPGRDCSHWAGNQRTILPILTSYWNSVFVTEIFIILNPSRQYLFCTNTSITWETMQWLAGTPISVDSGDSRALVNSDQDRGENEKIVTVLLIESQISTDCS